MQEMKWPKICDSQIGPKIVHVPKNSIFPQSVTLWGHAL